MEELARAVGSEKMPGEFDWDAATVVDLNTNDAGPSGSPVGTVLAKRYKILEKIGGDSFRAHDLTLDQTVSVRQAKLTSQRERDTWRKRIQRLTSVRHPNFLNVLDLILDESRDLVVTERPLGHSIAEFLKERSFDLEDVVRLMPLTALDLATTYASRPNSISARWLFVETTRQQDEQIDLKRRPIFDWPPIVIKLDVWELVRLNKNLTWPFLNPRDQESGSTGWAVRQAAQLTYELLGGEKKKGGQVKRWFKPVNGLGAAGNSVLYCALQGSPRFETSEDFFHKLESAIRSGAGASRALPAPALQTREHSKALPGTNDVINRFNRDTGWLATGVLGTVVFAALVLAVQEHEPNATQTDRDLLLNANTAKVASVVAKTEPAASTPVLALAPEINRNDAQANPDSGPLARRQGSARAIGPEARNIRNRSSVASRSVDVKRRLIELWHQSLAKTEKSRSWTAFSNLNRGVRKKAAYTVETSH